MVIGPTILIPPSWHQEIQFLLLANQFAEASGLQVAGFDVRSIDSVWHYASCQYPGAVTGAQGAADLDPESKREKHY